MIMPGSCRQARQYIDDVGGRTSRRSSAQQGVSLRAVIRGRFRHSIISFTLRFQCNARRGGRESPRPGFEAERIGGAVARCSISTHNTRRTAIAHGRRDLTQSVILGDFGQRLVTRRRLADAGTIGTSAGIRKPGTSLTSTDRRHRVKLTSGDVPSPPVVTASGSVDRRQG